jgi:hypothetical protein
MSYLLNVRKFRGKFRVCSQSSGVKHVACGLIKQRFVDWEEVTKTYGQYKSK